MFLEWLGLLTLIFLLETREWLLEKGRIRSVAGWTQTWITVPQLWQCLEFFLYSVQCSRYKARQCLVFIYEWIHLAACEMMVRQVCVWEKRERKRKRMNRRVPLNWVDALSLTPQQDDLLYWQNIVLLSWMRLSSPCTFPQFISGYRFPLCM